MKYSVVVSIEFLTLEGDGEVRSGETSLGVKLTLITIGLGITAANRSVVHVTSDAAASQLLGLS